jgi:predicted metal-dependent hydrolase
MHRSQNIAGRLVEVSVKPPLTLDEIKQFVQEHKATISRIPDRYVGVVDLHRVNVFPPEVANALIQLLSQMADRVERTAFLIGESAVFALQIERVIRDAANPNRKSFREPGPLKEWLGEVLNEGERFRLDGFLTEVLAAEDGGRPA